MPDQFQCPKCSAAYARERRRVGKAVVCACGHKFLVPPPNYEAPPPATRVRSSDSSAEVLPLAEVVGPAPRTSPVRQARQQRRPKRSSRPLGIFLLALLHFLVGAIFMAAALSGGSNLGLSGRHSSESVLVVGTVIASLVMALGVGVLLGAKWIWWLEAFGIAYSISSNAVSVVLALLLPLIPGFLHPMLGGLSALFIFKYLTRVVLGSLFLAYLFKENVLAFFGLKRLDTGQALGILFGIAITLTLLLTGVALVLLRARVAPAPSRQAARAPVDRVPIQPAPANTHPRHLARRSSSPG
jgi:hypothetical protein